MYWPIYVGLCVERYANRSLRRTIPLHSGVKDTFLSNARDIVALLSNMARGGSFLVLVCQLHFNDRNRVHGRNINFDQDRFYGHFADPALCQKIYKIASKRKPFHDRSLVSASTRMNAAPLFSLWTHFSNGWMIFLHRENWIVQTQIRWCILLNTRREQNMTTYADLLNAAFCTNAGHLEKWLMIILKLGRYGIASWAFFQLTMIYPLCSIP